MERVKHERAGLMESLAKLQLDQGKSGKARGLCRVPCTQPRRGGLAGHATVLAAGLACCGPRSGARPLPRAGGELQQEDIRILRREIEAKKEKLSELAKEARRLMDL